MTADNRMYVRVADWKAQPGHIPGDDADSFIRREGPEAFRRMIDTAKPHGVWVIEEVERELEDEEDIYVIAAAIKGLVEMAAKEPDPVIRAHYLRRIAEVAQVDESALMTPVPAGRPVRPARQALPGNVTPIYRNPEYSGVEF
jgi:DNA primase